MSTDPETSMSTDADAVVGVGAAPTATARRESWPRRCRSGCGACWDTSPFGSNGPCYDAVLRWLRAGGSNV